MMESLEFMNEWKRMCNTLNGQCNLCPLSIHQCEEACAYTMSLVPDGMLEDIVHYVTEWSKAHPLVTNEMKFREIFGDNSVNSILAVHLYDIKRWLAEPYKEAENGNSN